MNKQEHRYWDDGTEMMRSTVVAPRTASSARMHPDQHTYNTRTEGSRWSVLRGSEGEQQWERHGYRHGRRPPR